MKKKAAAKLFFSAAILFLRLEYLIKNVIITVRRGFADNELGVDFYIPFGAKIRIFDFFSKKVPSNRANFFRV